MISLCGRLFNDPENEIFTRTLGVSVATPEPDPTRLAGPNRNPGDARLILLVSVLLNFLFQKCRDSNPRLDPVGGSKPEPGLLRHFQLSYQNIWLVLFILDFVISRKHFILGKLINIYTFKKTHNIHI